MEGIKRRGGIQTGGKIADEGFHGRMPESVEAEEVHFSHGLLCGPFFINHAVGGHEDASAIVTKVAVDEDFLAGIIAEEREKLDDLLVIGRSPAVDGDVDEMHAEGFGELALARDGCRGFRAKINNGHDTEFF